ncbi:ferrochelatase hem15 [Saxophila tyrrhenica]|uniref:Ferrochelatase hem15 n=1 Tax=Saxophila tyrrhenica TaxID=1690608 RepID=A0AAV9NWY6_9PEZI|nr:ferrochelatase hem15 [Saxophila tyrrhenica]
MLRMLRRNSKGPTEFMAARTASTTAIEEPQPSDRLTFFHLPAELRNEIYEHVISDATLSLPVTSSTGTISQMAKVALRRRKPAPAASINGLLLASKQCRQEYLSVLLSTINVVVEIKDFDFENLMRVSSSLGDVETRALQANRNLCLLLDTRNCTQKDLAGIRRWLDFRKDDKKLLPWKYSFPLDKHLPPSTVGRVRLMRELEYYADNISTLAVDVDDGQKTELRAIIDAFEGRAMSLEEDLGRDGQRSKSLPRNVRGLAGGGLM